MKLLSFIKPALVLVVALSATTASFAAPDHGIYYVDRTFETGSVTGSIEVDHMPGMPDSMFNIMAWNLHLVSGANSIDLNVSNSQLFARVGWLTATSHDLLYDFSSEELLAFTGFSINDSSSTAGLMLPEWCLQSGGETVAVAGKVQFKSRSGVQVIASVPEPEAYGMLLAGLGLLAWVGRRRHGV